MKFRWIFLILIFLIATIASVNAVTIDNIEGGGLPYIAVDSTGTVHVTYMSSLLNSLRYAYNSGGMWNTETVYTTGEWIALDTGIAIDPSDNVYILTFLANTSGDPSILGNTSLGYFTKSGGIWNYFVVDNNTVIWTPEGNNARMINATSSGVSILVNNLSTPGIFAVNYYYVRLSDMHITNTVLSDSTGNIAYAVQGLAAHDGTRIILDNWDYSYDNLSEFQFTDPVNGIYTKTDLISNFPYPWQAVFDIHGIEQTLFYNTAGGATHLDYIVNDVGYHALSSNPTNAFSMDALVDYLGYAHVAHLVEPSGVDDEPHDLVYSFWNGTTPDTGWYNLTIDNVDTSLGVRLISLAIDEPTGTIYIAYTTGGVFPDVKVATITEFTPPVPTPTPTPTPASTPTPTPTITPTASPTSTSSCRGDPYCVDISTSAVRYNPANGTFLRYWINTSSTELPVRDYIWALILPLWLFFGWWIFAILWFVFLVGVWIRSEDIGMILIVGGVTGSVLVAFFPWEAKVVGTLILAISFAVLIMDAMYGRYD